MLAALQDDVGAGAKRLGWKVGFNTPAAMSRLGIESPIVGYLTDASLVADGGAVAIGAFDGTPILESEIAVRVDEAGEIVAQAAALEVVDLGDTTIGVERVLAGNIFHRAVMLGEFHETVSPKTGPPDDVIDMVIHVRTVLQSVGEDLWPGDVVITGAFALEPVAVGDAKTVDFGALGRLSVAFVG